MVVGRTPQLSKNSPGCSSLFSIGRIIVWPSNAYIAMPNNGNYTFKQQMLFKCFEGNRRTMKNLPIKMIVPRKSVYAGNLNACDIMLNEQLKLTYPNDSVAELCIA